MRLNIILLDSSLELVPEAIRYHPSVINNAKKRNKKPCEVLLDVSLHYFAMRNLPDSEKRGRPDIVHMAMIMFLSEFDIKGDFYIHTIDSKIIRINNKMRPPKNYDRFISLMEQLLTKGKVPPNSDNPLMEVTNLRLKDIAKKYKIILLSEKGEKNSPEKICDNANDDTIIGIGAFPHGEFSKEVLDSVYSTYSISSHVLETHQAICRIISACNEVLGWL